MKKIILGLLLMLGLCNAFAQTEAGSLQSYLEENVAITSSKARIISKTEYVVELTLKDFQNTGGLPTGFGLEEKVFSDDGRGYDIRRSDGIYTTKSKYTFKSHDRSNLESNKVIHDENFKHKVELDADPDLQSRVKFVCKFGRIGCPPPVGNCTACVQFGWQCWGLLYCELILEF